VGAVGEWWVLVGAGEWVSWWYPLAAERIRVWAGRRCARTLRDAMRFEVVETSLSVLGWRGSEG
jgi:hypothetical protein